MNEISLRTLIPHLFIRHDVSRSRVVLLTLKIYTETHVAFAEENVRWLDAIAQLRGLWVFKDLDARPYLVNKVEASQVIGSLEHVNVIGLLSLCENIPINRQDYQTKHVISILHITSLRITIKMNRINT